MDKFVRHAYTDRELVGLSDFGPAKTKQSFKDECDINRIMSRYAATGVLDYVERREAQFADVSDIDFLSAMQLISSSRSAFESLPSGLRSRFDNDPAKLLNFLNNNDNYQEAVSLGLVTPKAGDGLPGGEAPAGSPAPADAAGAA